MQNKNYIVKDDFISEEEFSLIVSKVGQGIPRLNTLKSESTSIYGIVESMTALSTWSFRIDFYGIGEYKIYSEVENSHIPELIATRVNSILKDLDGCTDINCINVSAKHIKNKYSNPLEDPEFVANINKLRAEAERNRAIAKRKVAEAQLIMAENDRMKSERERIQRKNIIKTIICLAIFLTMLFCSFIVYTEYKARLEVGFSPDDLIGLEYEDVVAKLESVGFTNVYPDNIADLPITQENEVNIVTDVWFGDNNSFEKEDKYRYDEFIRVTFHTVKMLTPPVNNTEAKGENYKDIKKQFQDAGFINIQTIPEYDIYLGVFSKSGEVKYITIEGEKEYGTSYRPDAKVVITYHDLHKNKPK